MITQTKLVFALRLISAGGTSGWGVGGGGRGPEMWTLRRGPRSLDALRSGRAGRGQGSPAARRGAGRRRCSSAQGIHLIISSQPVTVYF
ncbi:unnamed protein product [Pieris macdunnoughi]|uniref:Uncharacterized protein n=1 Tax=Pieris macdunnoughi TaxID=345717 RepID=A0A821KZV1_9NEOP|nr:unnamed protein product [Pieris macdunnoughi]